MEEVQAWSDFREQCATAGMFLLKRQGCDLDEKQIAQYLEDGSLVLHEKTDLAGMGLRPMYNEHILKREPPAL